MLRHLGATSSGGAVTIPRPVGTRGASQNPWRAGALEEGVADRNREFRGTEPVKNVEMEQGDGGTRDTLRVLSCSCP